GAADQVYYVDHPSLAEMAADSCAAALEDLVRSKKPRAVLVPLSNVTLGIGSLLAAKLGAVCINSCVDVSISDGKLQARSLLYGGKMEATVTAAGDPTILGISPGCRPIEAGRAAAVPPVEEVTVTLPDEPKVRFKRYIEPEAGDIDICEQEALVSVGRGIQSADNVELAQELAEALGGAVSGSRPVIDQGWLPMSRQVGKSGASVKPKFYLAAGISGAPEHVEGMKGAALIVAINTDPKAPIFNVAHYGIEADALDVLPALTAKVKERKGH
ncbi:MAG: electron transfer flavoprotein subunit alpha/FixB family protein, partial [Bryobacteraceae bacterium]